MTKQTLVVGVSRTDDTRLTPQMSVEQLLTEVAKYLPVERVCVAASTEGGKVELIEVGALTVGFHPTEETPIAPPQESAPPQEPLASLFPPEEIAVGSFRRKSWWRRLIGG